MARRIAAYLVAILLGIGLGMASALHLAGLWPGMKPLDFGNVAVDGWRSDFAVGSEAADPYTKVRVARHGLLALAKTEAVYFARNTDNGGEPLHEDCIYRVTGGAMPARWWSLTLYDAESMLPLNEDRALSIDATRAGANGEAWEALVAQERPASAAAWISSRNAGAFDLMLRLYVPDEALLTDPQAVLTPPVVERLSCKGDAS